MGSASATLGGLRAREPHHYVTRIAGGDEGMVILWQEDAGYEIKDPSVEGSRHRLRITKQGFVFDDSGLG